MTLAEAAHLSTILVMIGIVIGDVEFLAQPGQLRGAGFYSWEVLRTTRPWTAVGRTAAIADRVLDAPAVLALFAAQLMAGALAIAGLGPIAIWIGVTLTVNLVFHLRNTYGLDGSDQMQTIVLASLLLFYLAPTETARAAAICFIGAQAVLSYLTAGFAKAISPVWRSGEAVRGVLNTSSYGGPLCARVVTCHPELSRVACAGTLVFECGLPLLVFVSPTACAVFLTAGIAFHVGIASTMGLNLFFWSFVSTYPALYVLSHLTSVL